MAAYADIAFATSLYGADYVAVAFDRDGDGLIDTAATQLVLEIVSAEIDSFLVGRVPLPIPPERIPLDLKMRCIDLAIYRMCPDAARQTEEKKARFEATQTWLKMVARNEIKLTFGSAPAAGPHLTASPKLVKAIDAHAQQELGARWFSRENLKGVL